MGFSSSVRSHHRGLHGNFEGQQAPLYIKANTTCFQQKYSRLPGGAVVPETEWKMQQQQLQNLKKKENHMYINRVVTVNVIKAESESWSLKNPEAIIKPAAMKDKSKMVTI